VTDSWPLHLALLAAGVGAGFLNTVAGGGSMLTLPVLMLLGLPADIANGTNRLSVVSQALTGVTGFYRAGKLDRGHVAPVLAPTILGSALGAYAASSTPEHILEYTLLGTMMSMALLLALRPGAVTAPEGSTPRAIGRTPSALAGLFVAGVYAGFVQAGVGFLLLSVLGGLLRFDLLRANALKLVCALVFGVVALSVFALANQVAWLEASLLAAYTVIGSLLGVRFAVRVPRRVLRWVIFTAVVAVCIAALVRG